MITIRKAQTDDLDTLMDIFEQGKHIMRESGNLKQWTKGYPETATVLKDIDEGNCYVCQDGQGAVVGTFAFIPGKEPTYPGVVLPPNAELTGRHPSRQPHLATHLAETRFQLLRHHLSGQWRREAGLPKNTALACPAYRETAERGRYLALKLATLMPVK